MCGKQVVTRKPKEALKMRACSFTNVNFVKTDFPLSRNLKQLDHKEKKTRLSPKFISFKLGSVECGYKINKAAFIYHKIEVIFHLQNENMVFSRSKKT